MSNTSFASSNELCAKKKQDKQESLQILSGTYPQWWCWSRAISAGDKRCVQVAAVGKLLGRFHVVIAVNKVLFVGIAVAVVADAVLSIHISNGFCVVLWWGLWELLIAAQHAHAHTHLLTTTYKLQSKTTHTMLVDGFADARESRRVRAGEEIVVLTVGLDKMTLRAACCEKNKACINFLLSTNYTWRNQKRNEIVRESEIQWNFEIPVLPVCAANLGLLWWWAGLNLQ